jgi:hypothetical protein
MIKQDIRLSLPTRKKEATAYPAPSIVIMPTPE